MDLKDYVRLLRVRRFLIVVCALVGVAAAAALSLLTKPTYAAKAQLFVSADSSSDVSNAYTGGLFTQARVKSYATVITSPRVTQPVINQLHLPLTPAQLASKISASAPLDTVLINISVSDHSAQTAQDVANAVAQQFTKVVNQIERPDASGSSLVKVTLTQPAALPTTPVSPKTKLNIALGLILGLAIGIGMAVARETLDNSVKGVEEMQEQFGLATLGVIAHDPDAAKRPLIVHTSPHSTRAEAFRQLRTNLQFVDVDNRPRSIVVTSSVPREGKSTTTVNLAITLAQAGVPVILIEGDLRRPRVEEYMGMEGAAGLTDVLIGRVDVDDVLQPWGDTGNLHVLLSGPHPPNPSELLGSRQMSELLDQLQRRALVLIDAPPLLPVTDAAVLSTVTSGVLLIVAAGRTRREQVRQAVDSIRSVGGHLFGSVFNFAPAKGPDAYRYGYGYGYGYGYAPLPGRKRTSQTAMPERADVGSRSFTLDFTDADRTTGTRG